MPNNKPLPPGWGKVQTKPNAWAKKDTKPFIKPQDNDIPAVNYNKSVEKTIDNSEIKQIAVEKSTTQISNEPINVSEDIKSESVETSIPIQEKISEENPEHSTEPISALTKEPIAVSDDIKAEDISDDNFENPIKIQEREISAEKRSAKEKTPKEQIKTKKPAVIIIVVLIIAIVASLVVFAFLYFGDEKSDSSSSDESSVTEITSSYSTTTKTKISESTTSKATVTTTVTTESKTETTTPSEDNTTVSTDTLFTTKYYTLDFPISWENKYSYDVIDTAEDSYSLEVYHTKSHEQNNGGIFFCVNLISVSDEVPAYPSALYLGDLKINNESSFYVYAIFPTDAQFTTSTAKEYQAMHNDVYDILGSLKGCEGAEFTVATETAPITMQTENYDNSYYFDADEYDFDYLSIKDDLGGESYLNQFTSYEIQLMINVILARNGYIFNDEEIYDYFYNFDWYYPNTEDIKVAESRFTDIENENYYFLANYRDNH